MKAVVAAFNQEKAFEALVCRAASCQQLLTRAAQVCFMDENTNVLASGADDGLVKVWDRRELRESRPRPVGELAGHVDGVAHVTSRGDGRHVASSSKDQSIKVKKL